MTRDVSVFVKCDTICILFFFKLPQIRTSNFCKVMRLNAATCGRYAEKYYMRIVGNFVLFPAVKEF